jgi:hypothetical protein
MRLRMMVAVVLGALVWVTGARVEADPLPGGTFDPYVVQTASGPIAAVSAADLNGDRQPDVAAGGTWTAGGTLEVFPGVGHLNFSGSTSHDVLAGARSVATGDLNDDGRADLAVAAQTQVEVFHQTQAGTLIAADILELDADKLRIADVTGDGRADIVVIGWSSSAVVVFAQTPAGSLAPPKSYPVSLGGYNDLEVGDIDGDNHNDIVAMSGQLYAVPNVTILLQQPDGNLAVRGSYNVPGGFILTRGIGLGDIDGDGLGEVVASRADNSVTVFDAAADGALTPRPSLAVTNGPESVEVADMDLDGYDDAVIAHGGWMTVTVFYGSAEGLTGPGERLRVPMAGHYGLALTDLDLDGDREIVLAYNQEFLAFRNRAVPNIRPPVVGDFDGDDDTDISVFRPSTGAWLFDDGTGAAWGTEGDIATSADYDGDGRADRTVFRPSQGLWLGQASGGGPESATAWGTDGDVPVPGDYDGDGRADLAVFRPSQGAWFVKASTAGESATAWGTSGDVAVPADYDGDDKTDLAVFRPSTGVWFVNATTGGGSATAWGTDGDIPVPGDYDGDGRADLAVFRPSTGVWFMSTSTFGPSATAWGVSGDVPVPGDYDGDGSTDVAVFRPSPGVWFLRFGAPVFWGAYGDVPLPLSPSVGEAFFSG